MALVPWLRAKFTANLIRKHAAATVLMHRALQKGLILVLAILIAGLATSTAWALGDKNYKVIATTCKAQEFANNRWNTLTVNPFQAGEVLPGARYANPKNPLVILFKGGKTYAINAHCLSQMAPATNLKVQESSPVHRRAYPSGQHWTILLAYTSWEEASSILDPTGTAYGLTANQTGFRIGVSYGWHMTALWDFSMSESVIFGSSDVGQTAGQPAPSTPYSAHGAAMRALQVDPRISWRPKSGNFSVGLGVPLILRFVGWPDPAAGYALPSSAQLLIGVSLEPVYEWGRFSVSPQVGLLGSGTKMLWDLELGYRL